MTPAPAPFFASSGPDTGPHDAKKLPGLVLLAWTAFVAGTLVVLHQVGGALAPPPLAEPSGWGDWFDGRQPAEAVVAVLRLLALGLAWYLLAATVTGTVLRLAGAARLVRAADALTVPLVRRVVNGAVGLSLAAVALGGTAGAAPGPSHPEAAAVETMERLPDDAGAPPAPTMRRLPDEDPTPPPAEAPAPPSPLEAPAGPSAARTWEVRPGDHFWGVAERVLAEAWQGLPPTDAEVDPYWRTLVEANRSVLRDPGNPDLLFPGQVITVPPPPGREG